MADTGAPWNLPYPLPTDLVRDGADAIKDLAEAVASGLTDASVAGIGPNAVQTFFDSVFSTSSTTMVDVTGLEVTITPTSNTAKVLVIAKVLGNSSAPTGGFRFRLVRDATPIGGETVDPFQHYAGGNIPENVPLSDTHIFIDSPMTTSPTVYKIQAQRISTGSVRVNARQDGTQRGVSNIIAIEVAP